MLGVVALLLLGATTSSERGRCCSSVTRAPTRPSYSFPREWTARRRRQHDRFAPQAIRRVGGGVASASAERVRSAAARRRLPSRDVKVHRSASVKRALADRPQALAYHRCMSADAPRGPRDFDLAALPPDRFEELVYLLAHAVEPTTVPVRAKDQGLDARLPGTRGRDTLRGWQAKRHTKGINWTDCEESVRRAQAFWRPRHITFCFSLDLSAKDQDDFESRLVRRFPHVRLDYWPGSELQRLMRDTEAGQRAANHFFGDPARDQAALRRAIATGGELTTTPQAIERLAAIHEFLQGDPHFHYGLNLREREAPEAPPAPGTFLSVEVTTSSGTVRIDASERHPGALPEHGPEGALVFSDDELGQRAAQQIEQLVRKGGQARIESGLGIRMARVPPALEGLLPTDTSYGAIEISALPVEPPAETVPEFRQPVLLAAGGTEALIELISVDPPDEWLGAIAGGLGGLEVFFLIRGLAADRIESRLDWRWRAGVGTTLEQLLACEVMIAGLEHSTVELRDPSDDRVLVAGTMEEASDDKEVESLRGRRELLALLGELEAWTGEQLEPPAEWSDGDVGGLQFAVGRIRRPLEDVTWTRQRLTVSDPKLPEDLEQPHQLATVRPIGIRLFGREVWIGHELLHLPEVKFDLVEEGRQQQVYIEPLSDPGHATLRLFPPEEGPPLPATLPSRPAPT